MVTMLPPRVTELLCDDGARAHGHGVVAWNVVGASGSLLRKRNPRFARYMSEGWVWEKKRIMTVNSRGWNGDQARRREALRRQGYGLYSQPCHGLLPDLSLSLLS
jgi:hypothetical protein